METIIVRPRDAAEAKAVLEALKKMNVEASLHSGSTTEGFEPTDEEVLQPIERGMTEVEAYKEGKAKLHSAKRLLDEL
jgi:hypothetical protein